MVKIDYGKISESNLLVHKVNEVVRVKFLDEGSIEKVEITELDKDGNPRTKLIDKYTYQVIDLNDNQEKEYSALSKRFVLRIKEVLPIKNKEFRISKIQTGNSKFDIDYKIESL